MKCRKIVVSIFLVMVLTIAGGFIKDLTINLITQEAIAATTEYLKGKTIDSTCWNETLNYAGNVYISDGNSQLTAKDALVILKYVVGLENDVEKSYADANQDGVVNVEDALYVLKCAVKLEEPIVIEPQAYEIYQFEMVQEDVIFFEPSEVKDYWRIIESTEELQEFVEGDLEFYFGPLEKLKEAQKEHVRRHFVSLDEDFFEKNLYVVNLNGSEPYAITYAIESLEYVEDEAGQRCGMRLNMILGSRDGDIVYPPMEIKNVYGGVVLSREELNGLEIVEVRID